MTTQVASGFDIRVFVYGSLRRGGEFHGALAGTEWLGDWVTPTEWYMWDYDGYPALTPGGRTAVVGEVYRITESVLARLDEIEEYPERYLRSQIETPFGQAWVYVVPDLPTGAGVVESGDWFRRRPG